MPNHPSTSAEQFQTHPSGATSELGLSLTRLPETFSKHGAEKQKDVLGDILSPWKPII